MAAGRGSAAAAVVSGDGSRWGSEAAVAVTSAVAATSTAPRVETFRLPTGSCRGIDGSGVSGSSSGVSSEHGSPGSQAASRAADLQVMVTVTATTTATAPAAVASGADLPQEDTSGLW